MIDKEYCEKLKGRAIKDIISRLEECYRLGDLRRALDELKIDKSDASTALNRAAIDSLAYDVAWLSGLDNSEKIIDAWRKSKENADSNETSVRPLGMDNIAQIATRKMMSTIAEEDLRDVMIEFHILGEF